MKPLSMVNVGVKVRIVRIEGGRGLRAKLRNMGIAEGEDIKVINNHHGSLLVSHKNTRYAIGRGMTHRVLVDEVASG